MPSTSLRSRTLRPLAVLLDTFDAVFLVVEEADDERVLMLFEDLEDAFDLPMVLCIMCLRERVRGVVERERERSRCDQAFFFPLLTCMNCPIQMAMFTRYQ